MPKRRSESGFTLMEVLVASAILGITVAALMGGLSGSLRNLSRAEDYEKAILSARAQLQQVLLEPKLKQGKLEGRFDESSRWEAEITPWDPTGKAPPPPPDAELTIASVRLTVFWNGLTGEKSLTLETVKYVGR